jgi:hypothetical protein
MQLVDIIHNFLEYAPIYLDQIAVSEGENRSGARCVVDDAKIAKGIPIGEGSLLLAIDLDLADSLEDNVVGPTLIPLAKNIIIALGGAGFHFFDEAVDLFFG